MTDERTKTSVITDRLRQVINRQDYLRFPNVPSDSLNGIDVAICDGFFTGQRGAQFSISRMYTYFFRSVRGGPIKIGKAKDISKRLAEVQCGNPDKLECIAYLYGDFETELHRKFSAFRMCGEWFGDVWTILAFIRETATPSGSWAMPVDLNAMRRARRGMQ